MYRIGDACNAAAIRFRRIEGWPVMPLLDGARKCLKQPALASLQSPTSGAIFPNGDTVA
jgi:hypothetical protein